VVFVVAELLAAIAATSGRSVLQSVMFANTLVRGKAAIADLALERAIGKRHLLFPFLRGSAFCILRSRSNVFLKAILRFLSAPAIANKRQRGRHCGVKGFGFPDVY